MANAKNQTVDMVQDPLTGDFVAPPSFTSWDEYFAYQREHHWEAVGVDPEVMARLKTLYGL